MTGKGVSKLGLILCYIGLIVLLICDNLTLLISSEAMAIINEVSMVLILFGTTINTGAISATAEQIKVDKSLDDPSKIVDRLIENTQVNENERQNNVEIAVKRDVEDTGKVDETAINKNNIKGW